MLKIHRVSKYESNINNIYEVLLSSEDAHFKKGLTLSKFGRNKDNAFIMANIRRYVNGFPTKSGVCLTPYEYDWILNLLLLTNNEKKQNYELANKTSLRKIIINFKPNESLQIIQHVEDRYKRITSTSYEKNKLIENYGNFYDIIDEMEAIEDPKVIDGEHISYKCI